MESSEGRVLAYKQAHLIEDDEMANISGGGGATGTTYVVSKQTFERNVFDVGFEVRWD